MSAWVDIFQARAQEVEIFFSLLIELDAEGATIGSYGTMGEHHKPVDNQARKMLKATAFLVLYNLVESTIRNGIVAIFDELRDRRISFDVVRLEVKKVAISNLKRRGESGLEGLTHVAVGLLWHTFDKDDLFSGNVDAKKIRETAEEYGFSSAISAGARGGARLLNVKRIRNELGHGEQSFEEIGRDHSVEDLVKIKTEVLQYMADIVSNIDRYISHQEFLAPIKTPL